MKISSNRRVGTFTLGVTLVGVGAVSLVRLFAPALFSPLMAVRLWPVVLILLGGEILMGYSKGSEEKIKYDGWAILFVAGTILFTACMASIQMAWEYSIAGRL